MNKEVVGYIYNGILLSGLKQPFAVMWMDLESVKQSEATGAGILNVRDPCAGSGGYVDGPGWKETP